MSDEVTTSTFYYKGEIPETLAKGDKIITVEARSESRNVASELSVYISDPDDGGGDDTPGFPLSLALAALLSILIIKRRKKKG